MYRKGYGYTLAQLLYLELKEELCQEKEMLKRTAVEGAQTIKHDNIHSSAWVKSRQCYPYVRYRFNPSDLIFRLMSGHRC